MPTEERNDETAAGDLLAAALVYAARGWRVLPLHDGSSGICSCIHGPACKTPGKHPRIDKWPERASCDPALIAGWWQRWPSANVGIATGRRSDLVVLDVDPRHGGDDELAALVAEHESLPDTPVALTGGGGVHYYFRCPAGEGVVKSVTLADGLELKADGTFVVAPPSLTGEKRE
ncbi:MAG: bifunctional DNA primase/polymerase [Actinobacteria bacterium]|nr:bifunctional DNA primase/polymerase [Actinomycetota bacterium]